MPKGFTIPLWLASAIKCDRVGRSFGRNTLQRLLMEGIRPKSRSNQFAYYNLDTNACTDAQLKETLIAHCIKQFHQHNSSTERSTLVTRRVFMFPLHPSKSCWQFPNLVFCFAPSECNRSHPLAVSCLLNSYISFSTIGSSLLRVMILSHYNSRMLKFVLFFASLSLVQPFFGQPFLPPKRKKNPFRVVHTGKRTKKQPSAAKQMHCSRNRATSAPAINNNYFGVYLPLFCLCHGYAAVKKLRPSGGHSPRPGTHRNISGWGSPHLWLDEVDKQQQQWQVELVPVMNKDRRQCFSVPTNKHDNVSVLHHR